MLPPNVVIVILEDDPSTYPVMGLKVKDVGIVYAGIAGAVTVMFHFAPRYPSTFCRSVVVRTRL